MTGPEESTRFVIHGRVQGVGYRNWVQREVMRIGGLKGHVRNLRDGSVELCVAGEADRIARLHGCLKRGPPLARVDRIDQGPFDPSEPPGPFCIVFRG